MTKAEELANQCSNEIFDLILNNAGSHADNVSIISRAIEQYGRLVQEAAAKVAEKSADGELDDYAAGGAYSAAEAIKRMTLP